MIVLEETIRNFYFFYQRIYEMEEAIWKLLVNQVIVNLCVIGKFEYQKIKFILTRMNEEKTE